MKVLHGKWVFIIRTFDKAEEYGKTYSKLFHIGGKISPNYIEFPREVSLNRTYK